VERLSFVLLDVGPAHIAQHMTGPRAERIEPDIVHLDVHPGRLARLLGEARQHFIAHVTPGHQRQGQAAPDVVAQLVAIQLRGRTQPLPQFVQLGQYVIDRAIPFAGLAQLFQVQHDVVAGPVVGHAVFLAVEQAPAHPGNTHPPHALFHLILLETGPAMNLDVPQPAAQKHQGHQHADAHQAHAQKFVVQRIAAQRAHASASSSTMPRV
jgi:tryptophanase